MSDQQLTNVFAISGSALQAQNARMKVIAENIANATTTASTPGGKPYQRQTITFKNEFDKTLGAYTIKSTKVGVDGSSFTRKYDPANPGSDGTGYVMTPNVNPLIEMMDMGEANRAYQANLGVIESARGMVLHTISLLQ